MRFQKHHVVIGLVAAVVLYLIVNGIYNFLLSEEQKVKNLFYQMASDVEDKDFLGFGDYFTSDAVVYYGDHGIQKANIVPFMIGIMRSYEKLKISFTEISVELKGGQAVVTFAGDAVEAKLKTRGSFEGTAKLRKVDGEWKVYNATGRRQRRPQGI